MNTPCCAPPTVRRCPPWKYRYRKIIPARFSQLEQRLSHAEAHCGDWVKEEADYCANHLFVGKREKEAMSRILGEPSKALFRYRNELEEMKHAYRKRTRNIRLRRLKTCYLEQLRERSRARMEEYIQERTVLESELEECIWEYYRQTAPSLQEFYSRYTPEWEVFYEHETLPPTDFLIFLKRMETAFRKRYTLPNSTYPITSVARPGFPERSEERAALQELFLDKWHHLLTVKEYDYQYQHLFRLCEGFQILDKSFGLKTEGDILGSRVKWLLRNHPELYHK